MILITVIIKEDNAIEMMVKINAILLCFIIFRSLLDVFLPFVPLTSLALLFLFPN